MMVILAQQTAILGFNYEQQVEMQISGFIVYNQNKNRELKMFGTQQSIVLVLMRV